MSYIDKNLMQGEKIIYRARLHRVVFLWPVIWFVLAIYNISGVDTVGFGVLLLLVAILTAISSFINYSSSEFGITNKRVIAKVGFIRRNSLEVLLNKVEGIQVKQGMLGRMLNYGSITISGTGGTKDPFRKIADPLEFRRKAQEQIAIFQ